MKSYNIRFPLTDDADKNTYFQMNQITKDSFSADLLLLLLTEKGERYYEPTYGTNLIKFLFEPNDNLTAQDIEQEIKRTVSKFIPSLTITSVEFTKNGNQINVHLEFTYTEDAFTESGELDIKF